MVFCEYIGKGDRIKTIVKDVDPVHGENIARQLGCGFKIVDGVIYLSGSHTPSAILQAI